MSCLSEFLNNLIHAVHHASQRSPNTVSPLAAHVCTLGNSLGYLSALLSSSFLHSLKNISHLCSAGWHILRCTHRIVPSDILSEPLSVFPPLFSWESSILFFFPF
jgi:hypothetical protein